jgi:hypothetical protein
MTDYDLQKYQKDQEAARQMGMLYLQQMHEENLMRQQQEQQRQQNRLRWRQTNCSTAFGSTYCNSFGW